MLTIIIRSLMLLFILAVWAVFVIEFAVGCGESYVAVDGLRYIQDCVIIPVQK